MRVTLLLAALSVPFMSMALPTGVTATWDFQTAYLANEVNINGTTGTVNSDVDEVVLTVDATNGKLTTRGSDAQFNSGTILQVPVGSANDVVTVVAYTRYHNYTVGGIVATADETIYNVKSTDVANGYVEIVATGSAYLYSISVQLNTNEVEKLLYSTTFTEWGEYETKTATTVTGAAWTTKFSNEDLTFSIYNTQIGASNFNTGKFPDWTGGMLMAAKSDDPYVTTSALKSITKVEFTHGATGKDRGWKLDVKGDGDADWVTVSSSVANPSTGCTVSVDVNRTNCQLRFTNLTSNQNAYLFELKIYGKVDLTSIPQLGNFTYNGVEYISSDIFAATDDGMAATIELSNDVPLPSGSEPLENLAADNGTLGTVTYTANETDGSVAVTMPVELNGTTTNFVATFVHKPYYTVTYYNVDGKALSSTKIEKDMTLGTLPDATGVAIADGHIFRGWFESADGGRKLTADEVVLSDLKIYAVTTEEEVQSTTARYYYNLKDKYFYDEDHEAINLTNTTYHDGSHGIRFGATGEIEILVGGDAYILVSLCAYSPETVNLQLTTSDGTLVGTVASKATSDGDVASFKYTGAADKLILKSDGEGTVYLHSLTINNVGTAPAEPNENGYYVINAGDADHLLKTLDIVNALASSTERSYIFLPDGVYDLGENVLTPISGDNISIIGQSMENTIIKNTAPAEGISISATFLITGTGTYFQDLTLQNAYDYYSGGQAGRAVVIQDKGNKTICKNVKMLSYQDTYYSNKTGSQFYFETSDIHGTVDFICGEGDVVFNDCTLTIEKRNLDGSGECTITAPSTDTSANQYGYVFLDCTIDCLAESFNYGRAWNNQPRCAYINTTLLQPDRIASNRWTLGGMNVVANKFVEYNTVNAEGTVVSPASKQLTFTYKTNSNQIETILTADEAATYTVDNILGTWEADAYSAQVEITGELTSDAGMLQWTAVEGVSTYAVFCDDKFVAMVNTNSYAMVAGTEVEQYSVRAANAYGGFGEAVTAATDEPGDNTALDSISTNDAEIVAVEYYSIDGRRMAQPAKGICIVLTKYDNGTQTATKILVK